MPQRFLKQVIWRNKDKKFKSCFFKAAFLWNVMNPLRRMVDRLSAFLVLDEELLVLSFINVVMSFSGSLYGSLLGIYITGTLGVSILIFGLMNTTRDLISSLASFPSGVISDNFGRKKMMLLAIVFSISTLVLLFLFKEPFWLARAS